MTEKQEGLLELLTGIDETEEQKVQVDGVDFQAFRKEFMAAVDVSKARRLFALEEKNRRLHEKKDQALFRQRKEAKGCAVAMDVKVRMEAEGISVRELLEEKKFQELKELFEAYYQVQLGEEFLGEDPFLIPLEEETFLGAVVILFYEEGFEKACRLLRLREEQEPLAPGLKELLEDLEKLEKAVEQYEKREVKEAEELSLELLEKYPGNRSLRKFQCRFYMERASESPREAERFVENCRKEFPEDGYFMKYKADLLWLKGSCQDALVLYAQAKDKTQDAAPLAEMDRLFGQCKAEVLDTCIRLLEYGAREEAGGLMELWKKLMPQDEEVEACFRLTQVERARTQGEIEDILKEILPRVEKSMASTPAVQEEDSNEKAETYYERALTRAWRRLGYHEELASLYTKVKCTSEEGELEWLAEEIRSHQIKKELRTEAFKLVGDVRRKQGQTKAAFENYRKALESARPSYVKTELVRMILTDLSYGDQRLRLYAKKSDAMPFLEGWLGKYGTLEEISAMVSQLV